MQVERELTHLRAVQGRNRWASASRCTGCIQGGTGSSWYVRATCARSASASGWSGPASLEEPGGRRQGGLCTATVLTGPRHCRLAQDGSLPRDAAVRRPGAGSADHSERARARARQRPTVGGAGDLRRTLSRHTRAPARVPHQLHWPARAAPGARNRPTSRLRCSRGDPRTSTRRNCPRRWPVPWARGSLRAGWPLRTPPERTPDRMTRVVPQQLSAAPGSRRSHGGRRTGQPHRSRPNFPVWNPGICAPRRAASVARLRVGRHTSR